jgi:hypothetical protein
MGLERRTEIEEKQGKLLSSFILPNESFKWDLILEQYAVSTLIKSALKNGRDVEQTKLTDFLVSYIYEAQSATAFL